MRRVDRRRTRGVPRARFEIDRVWLWRGCLALVIIAFIVVFAKASILMFGNDRNRLERHERAIEGSAVVKPAEEAPAGVRPSNSGNVR